MIIGTLITFLVIQNYGKFTENFKFQNAATLELLS